MKKQHHMDVPGSGGHGSRQGSPALNKRLMATQPNQELTSQIRDPMYQWPSTYEQARSMTGGKWGKGGQWK